MSWRAVDVERLVGEDHPARAIWTLIGHMDLSQFYQGIESSAEEGGRPAFDPQLLISLWVYAYSQGIGSAREVARRGEYDPAFQWLTAVLRYDNLKSAVKKILRGHQREETTRFMAFRSHWGFASEFFTPGEGHEKGGVEGEGGYFRRNHMVPVPQVASWEALNLFLLEASRNDEQRLIGERAQTVGAGMNLEREHLRALAEEGFDLAAIHFPHVNTSGCVKVLTNFTPFRYPSASKCRPRCIRPTWRFGTRESAWRGTNAASIGSREYNRSSRSFGYTTRPGD